MSDSEGGSDLGDFDSVSFPSDMDDTELYVFYFDVSHSSHLKYVYLSFEYLYLPLTRFVIVIDV